MGFSNVKGRQIFFSNASSATNSLLQLADGADYTWSNKELKPMQKTECEFETIDNYLQNNKIDHVDLLKLDVQGAEHKIFEGASNSLRAGKIKHIYLELITGRTYTGQKSLSDYMSFFESIGFRIQGMFNFVHGRERELLQFDALLSYKKNDE